MLHSTHTSSTVHCLAFKTNKTVSEYLVHIQANIYNILYLFSKFFSVLTRLGVFPTLSYYNVYCTIHFVNVCLILFIQGTFPSSGLFAGVLCTAVPLHCRHSAALLMNHQAKIIYISFLYLYS